MKRCILVFLTLLILLIGLLFIWSCENDDSDSQQDDDNNDDSSIDDDDDDDDDDNDDDNDDAPIFPTTLDKTLVPVESPGGNHLEEGPGEPHILRNDLLVNPTFKRKNPNRLSMSYFTTISDTHLTDEESPTRLAFLHAWTIMWGAFESFHRPQEDLTPHLLNTQVRTTNGLQVSYGRDFDFGFILGDGMDNGQKNEIELLIDILDGRGLLSEMEGVARPDSGDFQIDPDSGLNLGERHFGIQETDSQGNNTNPFSRSGYPNSNADFESTGLVRSDGSPLIWFYTIGNHDVLANGGFNTDGAFACHTKDDYLGGRSSLGFIPGIGAAVEYMANNPDQPLWIGCGLFGMDINWQNMLWLFRLGGDWSNDIDPRFDLLELVNNTPEDPSDDGVLITPDPDREFMGHDQLITMLNKYEHGFADNNNDHKVNALDGGWYRVDWSRINADSDIPLRLLVLDTTDVPLSAEGGISQIQLSWLENELVQSVADRVLVIVISHHYLKGILTGSTQFKNLLNNCPNVIMHLVGHGHTNVVTPHVAENGDPLFGYWEVQTPSNRDFPQQARIFEIVDNRNGTGSIYSTLYDLWPMEKDDPDTLASLGRQLSVSEWEWGFSGLGSVYDRNVELLFAIPQDVSSRLMQITSDGKVTSVDSLGTLYD